jgi:predicted amidohydrolase YtcJ
MRQYRQVGQISLLMALLLVMAACSTAPQKTDSSAAQQIRFTLVIVGGTVYNGEDTGPVVTDIGILGDRIAAIGDLSASQAEQRLDAGGLAVTPGLIDIHSHAWRVAGRGELHPPGCDHRDQRPRRQFRLANRCHAGTVGKQSAVDQFWHLCRP